MRWLLLLAASCATVVAADAAGGGAPAAQQLGAAAVAAAECPYLEHTLPGLNLASPCVFPPCLEDSDGCVCMLHQVDYCDQPVAAKVDPFCASMVSWDPAILAGIEKCRSEAEALQAFWACPYLEQTVNIVPPLIHDTPCRHEACIVDSDSCDCVHYQNLYCSQPQAASQDGSCIQALFLSALAECPAPKLAPSASNMEAELSTVRAELAWVEGELAALKKTYAPPPPVEAVGAARTVFDEIVAKKAPADVVYEDEHCLAFRDIHPAAPVHVLVVPKAKLSGLVQATSGHTMLLGQLMQGARAAADAAGLTAAGYRVVINEGEGGGQSVPYLHLHVLGGRALTWPPG